MNKKDIVTVRKLLRTGGTLASMLHNATVAPLDESDRRAAAEALDDWRSLVNDYRDR